MSKSPYFSFRVYGGKYDGVKCRVPRNDWAFPVDNLPPPEVFDRQKMKWVEMPQELFDANILYERSSFLDVLTRSQFIKRVLG